MYGYFKKIICLILMISIFVPTTFFVLPKKAEAQIPVTDGLNLTVNTVTSVNTGLSASYNLLSSNKETVLDPLAYYAARFLIRTLTQSIVDWINNGFNGNPSFIEDPKNFLLATADRTIGEFIFDSDLNFLCKPFEINVRLALGLQYNPFQDKIRCTLSDVLQNSEGAVTQVYEDFMNGDFIAGGGWDTWLQVTTVPQNNQLGAMLIAQAELDARLEGETKRIDAELTWGDGLLSQKQCEEITYDASGKELSREKYSGDARFSPSNAAPGTVTSGPTRASGVSSTTFNVVSNDTFRVTENDDGTGEVLGNVKQECKIVTPGSFIVDILPNSINNDLAQLQLADEFNEIVGALANFAITKVMEPGGLLGRKDRDVAAEDAAWRQGIAELTNKANADLRQISQLSEGNDLSGSQNMLYNADITTGQPGSPGSIGGMDTATAKTYLQNIVSNYLGSEQKYFDGYTTVYNLASTTANKISSVIACYTTKPSAPNSASTISSANTRLNSVNSTKAAVTTNSLTPSQNNINALRNISNSVNSATTIDSLTAAANSLTNISSSIHAWDQAAYDTASAIMNQLNADLNTATSQLTTCSAL